MVFDIKDTGLGIPSEKIHRMFDKFTKIDHSYTSNARGYGLGLWIVRKLIKNLKGDISVKSKISKGTTFTVCLPVINKAKSNGIDLSKSEIARNKKAKRALLIEDNHIAQKATSIVLEEMGLDLDIIDNGKDVLSKTHLDYDIILTDVGLPDIDGFELIAHIQKKIPEHTEIVIVSAHASSDINFINRAKSLGVKHILEKPVRKVILERII